MKEGFRLALLILGPLWLYLLRGNLHWMLAPIAEPDLLALGVAYACFRLEGTGAVAFAAACGLLAGLPSALPFGALALRDASFVACALHLRRNFNLDSMPLIVFGVFALLAAQHGVCLFLLRDELLPGAAASALPRLLFAALSTGLVATAFFPAADLVSGQGASDGDDRRRGAFA